MPSNRHKIALQTALLYLLTLTPLQAQIPLPTWKFHTGDNPAWAAPDFNDADWTSIKGNVPYDEQGFEHDGLSWYRVRFQLPSRLRKDALLKDSLCILMTRVDDSDVTYLNGIKIGATGAFPDGRSGSAPGYYRTLRRYVLPWNHPAIRWDAENVIAVNVYDSGGPGGIWDRIPSVGMVELLDFLQMNADVNGFEYPAENTMSKLIRMENSYAQPISGQLSIELSDRKGKRLFADKTTLGIPAGGKIEHTFRFPTFEDARATFVFKEKKSKKTLSQTRFTPFILTPQESPFPKITNATYYGARPGKPFFWRISATGKRPMSFGAKDLPPGLSIDPKTGIISGMVEKVGEYKVLLTATNAQGGSRVTAFIRIGENLLLTPPLGWNSWNAWGMSVSEEKVRASADALINSGLANHGWTYMNIDDGWQGERSPDGHIRPNEKFPDMKALGDYLHARGLKFGIYSSPGELTCGGLAGSLGHEVQDAETWASWGVDYLKYDWCSYTKALQPPGRRWTDWTLQEQILPFKKMSEALRNSSRDVALSIVNYGMNNVWEWADSTGAQLWRTTGDIEDTWESLYGIGFSQEKPASFNHPGGWGDPDMLTVGWLGWSDQLRPTRLTPTEQYTHISLWALLSAPMLIGCDVSKIDPFTYNLLANDMVLSINQDMLGAAPGMNYDKNGIQVWVKPLAYEGWAVGIFNVSDHDQMVDIKWAEAGILDKFKHAKDAWRQTDLPRLDGFSGEVYAHGVQLFILRK